MRRIPLAGLFVVLFASHANASEPTTYKAVVTDTEVKLRGTPSDVLPDAGALLRGSSVVVEKDEGNGWLAITAPRGSVSWVAFAFVEDPASDRPTPRLGFVNHEGDVTLAVGKAGLAQPLNIRKEKVPQGTAVLIIGPAATFDGKKWLPIEPPAGDVRYIPKTAVKIEQPTQNNFTVRVNENVAPVPPGVSGSTPVVTTPAGGPLATIPGPSITPVTGNGNNPPPAAKPTTVNHPLWAQAENAERENRLADAERLYFQLAAEMNKEGGDHEIASQCFTRIHLIRDKQRTARGITTGSTTPTSQPTNLLKPPSKEDRAIRPGTPEPLPSAASSNDDRPQTSNTGVLRRSTLTPDGPNRALYMLEAPQGIVKMYVVAGPGIDLERYLGKRVDVSGTSTTRAGLTKPYLVASGVEPAP